MWSIKSVHLISIKYAILFRNLLPNPYKKQSSFIYFYLTLEGLKKLITNCLQNSCCAKGQKKLDQMFFIIKWRCKFHILLSIFPSILAKKN